ncbi:DUF3224 domain-containing protein [Mumia zhuanghuii]|uniref:DUF3224 domain-containing protein n=1 Tax=Mumia zhuanghuii TaxID=2585211 RepID=A0A5C4ML96_9ACTN|nr:DUF3224 domain-containing protein [Mumia zhuanghuii]TNC42522.1 DUF3224 domain-containing protein [Mumia zhuanghuii]TNC42544.1 DUF3224 domain-containing protein [Mumia zhuanghuii]
MTYDKKAETLFTVAGWEESVLEDIDGTGNERNGAYYPDRGVTRATVRYAYSGDIEGEGVVHYLMTYKSGDAPVVALERFTGSIGGAEGSCVLLHRGSHQAEQVADAVEVVEGMGTGALETLRGEATISLGGHSDDGYGFTLHYTL